MQKPDAPGVQVGKVRVGKKFRKQGVSGRRGSRHRDEIRDGRTVDRGRAADMDGLGKFEASATLSLQL